MSGNPQQPPTVAPRRFAAQRQPTAHDYATARWFWLAEQGSKLSGPFARPHSQREAEEFSAHYRRAATELARVKAFSSDHLHGEYIGQAVATAHYASYRKNIPGITRMGRGFLFGIPALIRRLWMYHAIAVLVLAATTGIAYVSVMGDPDTYYYFVDPGLAQGRDPNASVETLRESLAPADSLGDEHLLFSAFLFTHNTWVAFLCFASGVMLGIPTLYLLMTTGLMLGAFTALFFRAGLSVEYLAWILPHGVPEIGSIILCGGAGLAVGHRVLNPGNKPRLQALADTGGDAALTAFGCMALLFVAGIIEGVFRQSSASIEVRYALFGVLLASLVAWILFVRGRDSEPVWKRLSDVESAST